VAGRIMSIKTSNDTIGNRTRDLPACSAAPQPTAPPRAPPMLKTSRLMLVTIVTGIYKSCGTEGHNHAA